VHSGIECTHPEYTNTLKTTLSLLKGSVDGGADCIDAQTPLLVGQSLLRKRKREKIETLDGTRNTRDMTQKMFDRG